MGTLKSLLPSVYVEAFLEKNGPNPLQDFRLETVYGDAATVMAAREILAKALNASICP